MTTAFDMVMQSLRLAYPAVSEDDLQRIAAEWEILPYRQDGEMVGAACMRGSEFHCMTIPAFRLRRKPMREFLRPLFERHNVLTTRVQHADTGNQRFNYAFGFRETWRDETFIYYEMAELPFGGKATCQQ